jgi:hypothetical protein
MADLADRRSEAHDTFPSPSISVPVSSGIEEIHINDPNIHENFPRGLTLHAVHNLGAVPMQNPVRGESISSHADFVSDTASIQSMPIVHATDPPSPRPSSSSSRLDPLANPSSRTPTRPHTPTPDPVQDPRDRRRSVTEVRSYLPHRISMFNCSLSRLDSAWPPFGFLH